MTGKGLGPAVQQADVRGVGFSRDFSVAATMTHSDRTVCFRDLVTGRVKATITAGDKTLVRPSFVFWKVRERRPRFLRESAPRGRLVSPRGSLDAPRSSGCGDGEGR